MGLDEAAEALARARRALVDAVAAVEQAQRAVDDAKHEQEWQQVELIRLAMDPTTPGLLPEDAAVPAEWVAAYGSPQGTDGGEGR